MIDEAEVSALEADAEMDVAELRRLYGAEEGKEEAGEGEDEGEDDSADESERVKVVMSAEVRGMTKHK